MTGDVRLQPRWDIQLDGAAHVVQLSRVSVLAGAPRRFTADGVEHSLGGPIKVGPRIATFNLAGHQARLTMGVMAPAFRAAYRRSLKSVAGSSWRRLPLIIAAYVFGGSAAGGGVAGAAAVSGMVSWETYELDVDGEHRGSWVLTHAGHEPPTWTFVDPGAPLPERDWLEWPAPRT